jgi:hypothetical protein
MNTNANQNTKYNVYKSLENNDMYMDYLIQRKNYIRENNKYIELVEYIENSKLDYYPNARILASLEYYKLIKKQDVSKFMLAINNINLLVSLFETLLNVNMNLSKIIKLQKWIKKSLNNFKAKLRGPALYNRALCVNDSDFVSLDDIKDIPEREFISFKDDTDFIYGYRGSAQFLVHKDLIRNLPKEFYIKLYNWIITTELSSFFSGRYLEWTWHIFWDIYPNYIKNNV